MMADAIPSWMAEEEARAENQLKTRAPVNTKAASAPKASKVKRITKGFQVEEGRAAQWDVLVATMKNHPANKRTGPQLIDEALDHLFSKYLKS